MTGGSVVTTRYKSNTSVSVVYGSALNGDYVVAQRMGLIQLLNKLKLNASLTNNICNRTNISQIGKADYN